MLRVVALFGVVVLRVWLWCLFFFVTAAAGDAVLLCSGVLWTAFVCACVYCFFFGGGSWFGVCVVCVCCC